MLPFRNNSLARLIIAVLFIESIAILLYFGFCFYKILFFNRLLNGTIVLPGEKRLIADINSLALKIIPLLFVCFLILFSFWLYRVYRNIEITSRFHSSYTPLAAAFSLIIPVTNLFLPHIIMTEIWTANSKNENEKYFGKNVINNWRFLFALVMLYALFCIFTFYRPVSMNDLIKGIYYKIFLHILCIHFSFQTIKIVEIINELEKKKLYLPVINRKQLVSKKANSV